MTKASLPVFRFVGPSGAGKTGLLERVISELRRRGFRVAAVKDTHHDVELDQAGKDTWRLARAGAAEVLLATNRQLTLFQQREARPTLDDVAKLVSSRADVLLAEGFRQAHQPAIVVWRAALSKAMPPISGPVIAVVGDEGLIPDTPLFDFNDVGGLIQLLLSRFKQ